MHGDVFAFQIPYVENYEIGLSRKFRVFRETHGRIDSFWNLSRKVTLFSDRYFDRKLDGRVESLSKWREHYRPHSSGIRYPA